MARSVNSGLLYTTGYPLSIRKSNSPPIPSTNPFERATIFSCARVRHDSENVRKVPSSFTSLGIMFVAPLPIIFPKESTVGICGLLQRDTTCCNAISKCEEMRIGSMHWSGFAPCPPFPLIVT